MVSLLSETWFLTTLILFVAYLVRGVAGFGSGLIAIPLLTLLHPLTLVVPLVVLLDYLGSAAQGVKHREVIAWKELIPLFPFTLIGCLLALYLFTAIELGGLELGLGVFVIVFALYQLLPLPPLKGSRLWCIPAGLFGGLIGTLFGTGGPVYMMYLTARGLDKHVTRASFATFFFIDGSIRLLGFYSIGLLHREHLHTLLYWLPAAAIGLLIGGRIHTGLSNTTFKYFISLLLVFSGYKLLTS